MGTLPKWIVKIISQSEPAQSSCCETLTDHAELGNHTYMVPKNQQYLNDNVLYWVHFKYFINVSEIKVAANSSMSAFFFVCGAPLLNPTSELKFPPIDHTTRISA